MKKWTQTTGIPNIFMLPKHTKNDGTEHAKIKFGASNEDPGFCPERLSALVRFVHKNMDPKGELFDENLCCERADRIQGVRGFFATAIESLNGKTWLEEIRGTVRSWGHYCVQWGESRLCVLGRRYAGTA